MKSKFKKLLALFLTLALALSMMVPSFAAEATEDVVPETTAESEIQPRALNPVSTLPNGTTTVYFTPQISNSQFLNIVGTNTDAIKNLTNVTTYTYMQGDPLQQWQVRQYSNGSCRIVSNEKPGWALEYYWGTNGKGNPGNADIYWYNIADNTASNASDCALKAAALTSSRWSFNLFFNSNLWLSVPTTTMSLAGQNVYNVCFEKIGNVPNENMNWYIYK